MVPQVYKAQHAAGRDRAPAELAACKHCQTEGRQGYWAPLPQDQPKRLRKLPPQVLEALRPLRIHAGPEQRAPRGYAVHGDMLRFSFKAESVREQIAQLPEKERRKAKKARKRLTASFWTSTRSSSGSGGGPLSAGRQRRASPSSASRPISSKPLGWRTVSGRTCTGRGPCAKQWPAPRMRGGFAGGLGRPCWAATQRRKA